MRADSEQARVSDLRGLPHQVWSTEGDGDVRSIRTVMSKVRRRVGDDPDNPTYIFTEPCVGYRMAKGESEGGFARIVAVIT